MTEIQAAALADLRVRVVELVHDVEPTALDAPAAATPGWRVRDVLAHMVGVSDDIVHGRVENIAGDEWTAAQVDKRREVRSTICSRSGPSSVHSSSSGSAARRS